MSFLGQWLGFYVPVEEYGGGKTNTNLSIFKFCQENVRKKERKLFSPLYY